ncbi:MAG: hypothetical protein ABL997_17080 [Planctomycetota bacterium]
MTEQMDPSVPPARSARRFVLPVVVGALVLLVVARETGVVDLSLSAKTMNSSYTSTGMRSTNAVPEQRRKRPDGTPLVDRGGLEIFAPRGSFTDVVLSLLPHHQGLTGQVEVVYDPPWSYVPLWKTADVVFDLYAELDLAREGKPTVHSQHHFHLEGNWRAIGLLSRREFVLAIADAVGQDLGKAFDAEVEQMRTQ